MSDHWYPDIGWEDSTDGDYLDVVPVHVVCGPAPFDGLRARDDEHAQEVCDALNEVFGRTVPDAVEREPEPPTPIATELVAAFKAKHDDIEVSASGNTITLTGKRTADKPRWEVLGMTCEQYCAYYAEGEQGLPCPSDAAAREAWEAGKYQLRDCFARGYLYADDACPADYNEKQRAAWVAGKEFAER